MPSSNRRADDAFARLADNPEDDGAVDEILELIDHVPATVAAAFTARGREGVGEIRRTWKDHVGERMAQPARFVRAASIEDLVAVVQFARTEHLHVRAVGSGGSFSDIAVTTGILVDTASMNEVLPLDFPLRAGSDAAHLFRFEVGLRVDALNQALFARGLALPNMGAWDGQTFAGAVNTGTHGSGLKTGAMQDCIVSVRLVDGRGQIWQIEPTAGITDPAAFAVPGVTLKQDDGWFHAAILSMGCAGLVHSVVIRARAAFWLRETRSLSTWNAVKATLQTDIRAIDHYELLVNPYVVKGQQTCLVTKRRELLPADPQVVQGGKGHRNPLTQMAMQFSVLGELIVVLSTLDPALMKRMIDRAMKGLVDEDYVDVSHKVLKLGASALKAYSSEIAVPLRNATLAAERVSMIAEENARAHGIVHTSPFSLRFMAGSQALLGQHGGETCMLEFPTVEGTVGGHEFLERYEDALYDLGGRPHWGQRHHLGGGPDLLRRMYPGYDAFVAVCKQLDPDGVFNNDFARKIGLWQPTFQPW